MSTHAEIFDWFIQFSASELVYFAEHPDKESILLPEEILVLDAIIEMGND